MTLDELIASLQEAKEHFVPGKSKVIINDTAVPDMFDTDIKSVEYDNHNVKIVI